VQTVAVPVVPAKKPAGQEVHTVAAAAENVPTGQLTQLNDKVAPVLAE